MIRKCCHFPICGGCTLLDKNYEEQISNKKEMLLQLFEKYSIDKPDVVKSPELYYYRHKVQLPFSSIKAGKTYRTALGCYARETHEVVNQKECLIQDRSLTAVAYGIRAWAEKTGSTAYNEKSRKGFLRHVLLRKGAGTGEILIGLVTNGDRHDGSRSISKLLLDIVQPLIGKDETIVGIVQNVNTRDTNVVLGETEYVWWGRPYIKELLGKLKFKMEMSTFFQVNPYQTPNLYNEALKNIPDGARVLDLYCGVGSISLWLASKVKEVTGIEENRSSVASARTAASLNEIKNAKFIAGDVAIELPKYIAKGFDCAVIDPPRKGLDKKSIDLLRKSALKRLVYVSCNPMTLERDISLMNDEYKLVKVTGVDMFPHTDHIEAVAVIDKK